MKRSLVYTLCCLLVIKLSAQDGFVSLQSRVTQLLDSALIPGLALATIDVKTGVKAQGFGVKEATVAQNVDENTVFSAASLSKPVFAYLVLQLVDAGKMDLDKPLYQYLPYPDAEQDDRYKLITARMALSHSPGFPNWRNGQLKVLFSPGKRFSYSGEGFVYLQKVVEHLTQRSLEDLAREKVFKPLGMPRSSFIWQTAFEDNYALRHNRFGVQTGISKFDQANAAYSLQTTAADYGKFLQALLQGKGLKSSSVKQLFTPQLKTSQKFGDTTQLSSSLAWGLGVGLQKTAQDEGFWHWGDNGDFKCFFFVSRTRKQGLVYFSNSTNGLSIAPALARSMVSAPMPCMEEFLNYTSYRTPLYQFGNQVLKKGAASAIQSFMSAEKIPFSADELRTLSSNLLRANRTQEAKDLLEESIQWYPDAKPLLKTYGLTLLQIGERNAAQPILEKYQQLDPSDAQISHLSAQLKQTPTGNVEFRRKNFPQAKLVTIAGSFNNWQPFYTLMYPEHGEWVAKLQLAPGKYTYKLVVDGKWTLDPENPEKEEDGDGNMNSVLIVK